MRDPLVPCDLVVESLSARADGESAPLDALVVETHLERCPRCRAFESSLAPLARRLRVVAEVDTTPRVALLLERLETRPPRPFLRSRNFLRYLQARASWPVALSWSAAVVPLAAALPVVALGLPAAHAALPHLLGKCSAAFAHHHLPSRGLTSSR